MNNTYIYCSSENRLVGETVSKFTNYLTPQVKGIKVLNCLRVTLSNTWYNFDEYDKYFYYRDDSDDIDFIELPTTKYIDDGNELATALTNSFSAKPIDIQASYSADTGKITLSSSTINFRPLNREEVTGDTLLADAANLRLGFVGQYSAGNSFQAENLLQLMRTQNIYVRSLIVSDMSSSGSRNLSNIICKIPVTKGKDEIIHHYFLDNESVFMFSTNRFLDKIHFELIDDRGLPIDLNGGRFSISMLAQQ